MMPNFLVIGAAKAGTTSLYYYLRQHPEIFMSHIKEPKFFWLEQREIDLSVERTKIQVDEYIDNIEDYKKLFQEVKDEKAVGEASPVYIAVPETPHRIKHHIPEAKLIALLRNPVDRARSAHSWNIQLGIEPLYEFEQAAKEELKPGNWRNYLELGLYNNQLQHYFNTFDKEQLRVYLYEDLRNNPTDMLQDIFEFLGVDSSFVPNMTEKFNVSMVPKYKLIDAILRDKNPVISNIKKIVPDNFFKKTHKTLNKWNSTRPRSVSPELRKDLLKYYKQDILQLQDLINRDLSGWLS